MSANIYRSRSCRTKLHADDEIYINQDSSICIWSLMSERDFNIFDKKNTNQPLKTFKLQHGSLMIMHPGSQSCTKHKVMPLHPDVANGDDDLSDLRISISWRDILDDDKLDQQSTNENSEDQTAHSADDKGRMDTSVIFGTSISKYLQEKRLQGRHSVRVVNRSESGATIPDVSTQMDNFFTSGDMDSEKTKITNVFISVGTNDLIKQGHQTPNNLYLPISNLLKKAKILFPGARVYFQSLLPMPIISQFTVGNVLMFNKLALQACAAEKCFFLDVFRNFLDYYGCNNFNLFRFNAHKNCMDVHLNNKGLGVLAVSYINIIRGRFNPIKH